MPDADQHVTLALHAAGPAASVAVGRGSSGLLHLEAVSNAARHDDDLMPAVARCFDRIGAVPTDLACVCVSIGPGGFTGLRIAVSTAKMLALAVNCRIVAVPETDVLLAAASVEGPLAVCLAGKHGQYWTAFRDRAESASEPVGQLLGVADIIERSKAQGISRIIVNQPPDRLADLAAAATAAEMDLIELQSDAACVLHVGLAMAAAGHWTVPEHLLPIYPREPEAVRLWRQRHA